MDGDHQVVTQGLAADEGSAGAVENMALGAILLDARAVIKFERGHLERQQRTQDEDGRDVPDPGDQIELLFHGGHF
ncbi:hypothetical protein [Hydrogenophaga sp.]|uniref:hypothetical protein n=1 Tax=Hydrogenophaga sp. TaxID=1904254 RepID=UPI0026146785|nr:hypothetical protein [Hydrogenophaga sp.]